MQVRTILNNFKSISPRFLVEQDVAVKWLARKHGETKTLESGEPVSETVTRAEQRFMRYAVKSNKIAQRGFDVPDVIGDPKHELFHFAKSDRQLSGAPLGDRSRFFVKRGQEVLESIYPEGAEAPRHIVHVTCTGYVSPSPAQLLVNTRNWQGQTDITHAYHMGCYAAVPAVRIADGLVARAPAQKVDIVHTEICTLHMNPMLDSPEQTIVQSLFADGHIRYTVSQDDGASHGFKVLAIKELLIPNTIDDMSWVPEDWGFRMNLSRDVPVAIGKHLREFVMKLVETSEKSLGTVLSNAVFAIHPGGPRIIDAVQEILELRDDQTNDSKEILRTRGNMSSATLPHIWQKIQDKQLAPGTTVVSLAFGPGLTIFGAVFEIV